MKMSFNTLYTTIVVASGLGFAAMALTAYVTGKNSLIFIGMGCFLAVCMSMTSVYARRQRKLSRVASK